MMTAEAILDHLNAMNFALRTEAEEFMEAGEHDAAAEILREAWIYEGLANHFSGDPGGLSDEVVQVLCDGTPELHEELERAYPPEREYPYDEGDTTVIGPEAFALDDGSVLSWRGENYVPQSDAPDVQVFTVKTRRFRRNRVDITVDDLQTMLEAVARV